jgi:hypothetical protein
VEVSYTFCEIFFFFEDLKSGNFVTLERAANFGSSRHFFPCLGTVSGQNGNLQCIGTDFRDFSTGKK